MVTVLRAGGFRVVIFLNDHAPAHVHVFGDGEAKVGLRGPRDVPELLWADSMTHADVRRAMRLVTERQSYLLARWEEIRGRSD